MGNDELPNLSGLNSDGQLGDGTTTNRLTPVQVPGGLRFRQVSAGDFHNCGVTTDSQAHCWGRNFAGQLGDGTTTDRLTPVPVAGANECRRLWKSPTMQPSGRHDEPAGDAGQE